MQLSIVMGTASKRKSTLGSTWTYESLLHSLIHLASAITESSLDLLSSPNATFVTMDADAINVIPHLDSVVYGFRCLC